MKPMFDAKLDQMIAQKYDEYRKRAAEPKTETGKQSTRLNAYKHGLTGQIHCFSPEEHAAFEKHCQSYVEALAPVGALEQGLAQSIAEGHWRLNRARSIESGIFALGQSMHPADPEEQTILRAISQAKTWMADGKSIQLLSLYENRIQRSIERHMAELRTLRAERKAARDQALEEAVVLSQLAESKGEKYDAAADFPPEVLGTDSVFSAAAIARHIARTQRLEEARAYAKTRVNPKLSQQMPASA
jgi:hypothetical protein